MFGVDTYFHVYFLIEIKAGEFHGIKEVKNKIIEMICYYIKVRTHEKSYVVYIK